MKIKLPTITLEEADIKIREIARQELARYIPVNDAALDSYIYREGINAIKKKLEDINDKTNENLPSNPQS